MTAKSISDQITVIEEATAKATVSKETAAAFLERAGIIYSIKKKHRMKRLIFEDANYAVNVNTNAFVETFVVTVKANDAVDAKSEVAKLVGATVRVSGAGKLSKKMEVVSSRSIHTHSNKKTK